jgi:hypothetical protein
MSVKSAGRDLTGVTGLANRGCDSGRRMENAMDSRLAALRSKMVNASEEKIVAALEGRR